MKDLQNNQGVNRLSGLVECIIITFTKLGSLLIKNSLVVPCHFFGLEGCCLISLLFFSSPFQAKNKQTTPSPKKLGCSSPSYLFSKNDYGIYLSPEQFLSVKMMIESNAFQHVNFPIALVKSIILKNPMSVGQETRQSPSQVSRS